MGSILDRNLIDLQEQKTIPCEGFVMQHNFVNIAKDTLENKVVILFEHIRNTLCISRSMDISKLLQYQSKVTILIVSY